MCWVNLCKQHVIKGPSSGGPFFFGFHVDVRRVLDSSGLACLDRMARLGVNKRRGQKENRKTARNRGPHGVPPLAPCHSRLARAVWPPLASFKRPSPGSTELGTRKLKGTGS